MINVGLNGFGRIGRAIFRINEQNRRFNIVAINDLDPNVANHAHLLKYDSIYGRFNGYIESSNGTKISKGKLAVNGRKVDFYCERDIVDVPWEEHDIDVIIDASGVSQNVINSHKLVDDDRVKKVVVTHSPKEGIDQTIIFGVNEESYNPKKHHVVSTSICDANAIAPVLRVLEDTFGVEQGYVTTLHPWLSYQNLTDGSVHSVSSPGHYWTDFSLGRASTLSLIPKDTTAANAVFKVMPEMASRIDAVSYRVPTGIVSSSDMTITLSGNPSAEDVKEAFRAEAKRNRRIYEYQEEPLVSIDFLGIEQSVVVDGRWIKVNKFGNTKLIVWYDNEWGYSQRVVDMVDLMASNI